MLLAVAFALTFGCVLGIIGIFAFDRFVTKWSEGDDEVEDMYRDIVHPYEERTGR